MRSGAVAPARPAEPLPGAPVRVLIVEDSPEDRATMRIFLSEAGAAQGLGFEFLECGMGEDGLVACRTATPDCILLDYHLPDMDGIEFLARLKAEWDAVPVAVVMLTASANRSLARDAFQADVQEYLPKKLMGPEPLMRAVLSARDRFMLQSERRRIERALIANEDRFRRMMEAAPSAMIMTGAAGLIEMVNLETERMFGYRRAELIGQSIDILVPSRLRGQHHHHRSAYSADPRPRPMGNGHDLFAVRKDGTEFQITIGLNPIEADDGPKVVSAIVDISARILLEAKFLQAQKMEAVGRLTAGVAHDFNNLLQALMGSLELMLDEVKDRPLAVEYGRIAYDAAVRGGKLTHRLLAFSRQQMLIPHAVGVRLLLANVEALLSRTFPPNIAVFIGATAGNCAVFADPTQLEAAVINLAVNARDAMGRSGGRLVLSAFESDTPAIPGLAARGYTVIVADDNGHGMDATTLAKAYEPFFTTKGLGGSGLGLSMVQGFARQSGGDVRIVSEEGRGCRVEIWLPSAKAVEASLPEPARLPAARKGRILLVDDTHDILVTIGAFLRSAGFEVTKCSNGIEALASVASGIAYDAIVTDYAMPGLNGMDLLAQVREIVPNLPGLIITGFSDAEQQLELADVTILRKPFTRVDLITAVQNLVSPRQEVHAG